MSYGETTEDLTKLINNTFTSCVKNYEALLPYLEKKETKSKIYNKLVLINMLLNKLNEELVGLRVQNVTVLSYQQKRENVLSEGSRKKRKSDVPEVGRCEPKNIKTEMSFSNITNHSVTLFSESGMNQQSENFLATGIEEIKPAQVQKSEVLCTKNITSEIQDSDEVVIVFEVPKDNSDIHTAQTLCDKINNTGSEENPSAEDKLIGGNEYDKPTDDTFFPLQNVECESRTQGKCEDSGNRSSKHQDIDSGLRGEVCCNTSSYQGKKPFNGLESPVDLTVCDDKPAELVERIENHYSRGKRKADHSPLTLDEVLSEEIDIYGIIRHKENQFQCTLCNIILSSKGMFFSHLKGKRHKKRQRAAKNKKCAEESEVTNNSCTNNSCTNNSCTNNSCTNNSCTNNSCTNNSCTNNSCTSTASVSVCSEIPCSLDNTVVIVQYTHQVISMKHAVTLDDVWAYFPETFQINKQFFRICSGQIVCSLCNKMVGRRLHHLKKHISRLNHLYGIIVLQNNELSNRSSLY